MNQWTVSEWKDLIEWTAFVLVVAFGFVLWMLSEYRARQAPESEEVNEAGLDAACYAVGESLGFAWDCTRDWSAWGIGTMTALDFKAVADNPERVAEIAHAAVEAYRAALAKGAAS